MYMQKWTTDILRAVNANLDTAHPAYPMPPEGVCSQPTPIPPAPVAVALTAPSIPPSSPPSPISITISEMPTPEEWPTPPSESATLSPSPEETPPTPDEATPQPELVEPLCLVRDDETGDAYPCPELTPTTDVPVQVP